MKFRCQRAVICVVTDKEEARRYQMKQQKANVPWFQTVAVVSAILVANGISAVDSCPTLVAFRGKVSLNSFPRTCWKNI